MNVNRTVSISGAVTTAVEVSSESGLYSSKSFTLLMNPDPEVESAEISGLSEDLKTFEARILGRAHDLEGEFDSAAMEFTEVIQWDISKLNEKDLATWMDVTSSVRFCAAITEEWADYVKEYKQERLRIIERWNEEAPALAKDLDKAPPKISFIWESSPAEEAEAALTELKNELQGQEETAYKNLDTRGEELSDDLKNGPTPESVQRLISGGYITWSYFNLGGDVEGMPIDVDPVEMAEDLTDYLNNPNGFEGDIDEIIVLLSNIGTVAMNRQNNGGTLTRDELYFLAAFYDSLEENGTNMEYPGILGVSAQISSSKEIEREIQEKLLGALGDGILVLSDESLLGGYHKLPESIQNVLEGPNENDHYDLLEWHFHIDSFSAMMSNSNPYLSGGEQFSVNLTQTIANHLDSWNIDPEKPNDFRHYPILSLEDAQSLIEVSSRNEDANHAIITGDGKYEHPVHGLDPEMTFRALYTQDWPDDGVAISGLTDWMGEQAEGEWYEQEQAGEAMAAFMELFSDPSFNNSISGTGHSVEGKIIDVNGNTVDVKWENASAAHVNPELAWAWSELFSAYIDSFASEYGTPVGSQEALEKGNHWDPDLGLMVLGDTRANFVQQIMGDPNAASRVYTETVLFGQEKMEDFVSYDNEGYADKGSAANAGIIRGIIDQALEEEANARENNAESAVVYQNKVRQGAIDMAGALMSEVPFPGTATAAEAFKLIAKENFNVEFHQAEEVIENEKDDWELENDLQILIIKEIAENDESVLEILREKCPGLVDKNGNVPVSITAWDVELDAYNSTLRDAWDVISENGSMPDGKSPEEILSEYTSPYGDARNKAN